MREREKERDSTTKGKGQHFKNDLVQKYLFRQIHEFFHFQHLVYLIYSDLAAFSALLTFHPE